MQVKGLTNRGCVYWLPSPGSFLQFVFVFVFVLSGKSFYLGSGSSLLCHAHLSPQGHMFLMLKAITIIIIDLVSIAFILAIVICWTHIAANQLFTILATISSVMC